MYIIYDTVIAIVLNHFKFVTLGIKVNVINVVSLKIFLYIEVLS